ncbi:MAG: leucyl aminopeptidase [Nanoarchaeota archaeon]|nr:leucyl aminopeptidase [Nanoarchaeota archaeon]MBU1269296.1 leucyl aminopeptidase [Nanoarchaeota archaeon]MBU1603767.1 leucyl aminopeptidase [Nanoarchaeota archaeon]MBU2443892.1 leucyl aminopeptidase [Nanoarchaeota archaeon]
MKLNIITGSIEEIKTELLIIGHFEDELFKNRELDLKLKNIITKALKEKKFSGEFKQVLITSTFGLIRPERIMLLGLGKQKEFTIEKLRRVSGLSAKMARESNMKSFTTTLSDINIKDSSLEETTQAVTEATILSLYQFTKYKTVDKEKIKTVNEVSFLSQNPKKAKKGLEKGRIIADATNYVRTLVNMPPSEVTPTYLANEAKRIAKEQNIKVTIFGKNELKKKGMNGILAVNKGSSQEPKLIILETNPKAKKKIAIVGKGVTFDSGGLDIKPWPYMVDMKSDMAGAAAVLGTVLVASKLKLPINVLGVMPAVENMPDGSAQKAGDIITSYNKKTIEVINTDAEGRIILADAIAYAEEQKPDAIIDLATLTGTCIYVFGYAAAAMVSNDEKLKKALTQSSQRTFERVWELPLWDDYRDAVKSDVGDVRNIPKGKGYEAGTITAATFIEAFVKNTPWAHLDIAGTAWFVEEKEYIPKGATGYGVRLLTDLLETWK